MSASAKQVKAKKEYAEVQTSKDGRRYVNTIDVLNSEAGRAEIRRQAENFELIKRDEKNGSPSNTDVLRNKTQ